MLAFLGGTIAGAMASRGGGCRLLGATDRNARRADHAGIAPEMDGMLAEFALLSENGAVRLPSAALTAWNTLMQTEPRLKPGASVLSLGTGGVSIFGDRFGSS
jgi:NADPH:quinone reductase-like Zn-dependent oxidoreductase